QRSRRLIHFTTKVKLLSTIAAIQKSGEQSKRCMTSTQSSKHSVSLLMSIVQITRRRPNSNNTRNKSLCGKAKEPLFWLKPRSPLSDVDYSPIAITTLISFTADLKYW
ncbi:MAG: hypothetical protein WCG61_05745, partial [Chlorobium sp.]